MDTALFSAFDGVDRISDADAAALRDASTAAIIARGNRERFAFICPPALHPDSTDWNHPGLAPHAVQIARVRGWDAASGKGLLLAGPTFRGKSRALWALAHRLQVTEARRISFFTASDFFSRLGEQVAFGRDDARGWIDAMARLPLLFIDDLGQEAITRSREDWARQWFFALLDTRRGLRLPLFITTNLTACELTGQDATSIRAEGHPLLSRITDVCEIIRF